DLDSHQDKRFDRPPCYFDTSWQWRCRQEWTSQVLRVRCPKWNVHYREMQSTCIVPLRRRMPHLFGFGSLGNWSARQDWTSEVLQGDSPYETFASREAMHL